MIFVAVAVFLTGALFGFYMFARHLKRRAIPAWSAVLHGGFGATGFAIVLLLMATRPEIGLLRVVLTILIGAIVLGVVNLLFHIRRVRHRTLLIVLHALAAVSGVGTLAYAGFVAAPAPAPGPTIPEVPSGSGPAVAMGSALSVPTAAPSAAPSASAAASAVGAAAPAPATAPKPAFPTGPAWTDHALVFDSSSASLDAQGQSDLAEVAGDLRSHPEITLVEVQGHSDERGDPAGNARLARARAASVAALLTSKGIAPSRLKIASYAGQCPADPGCEGPSAPSSCHDASSLARDRRVTLLVLESGAAHFHGKVACDAGMRLAPRDDDRYAAQ